MLSGELINTWIQRPFIRINTVHNDKWEDKFDLLRDAFQRPVHNVGRDFAWV